MKRILNVHRPILDLHRYCQGYIQEFINKVDIAQYLCYALDPYRWANLFVMEYLIAFTESQETMIMYAIPKTIR